MGKKSVTLLPKTGNILEHMGEQIRLAHMRRKISVALAAERAGVSGEYVLLLEIEEENRRLQNESAKRLEAGKKS